MNRLCTPSRRLWYRTSRSPRRKLPLYRTVVLACFCSRPMQLSWVRHYVRLSLPKGARPARRPQTAGLPWCASSVGAELTDAARLAVLETLIQRASCVRGIRGSRTCEGTSPANWGASAAPPPQPPRVPGGIISSRGSSALAR